MTRDEEIRRGDRAASLMGDDLMQEVFGAIELEQITAWRNSPARDAEGREKIYQFVKMLDSIRSHLQNMVDAGKMAQSVIETEQKLREAQRRSDEEIASSLGISVSELHKGLTA